MIERIVLIKVKAEYCTDAAREEIAAHSLAALEGLPGVGHVHVGVPADEASEKSWDLSIVIHFDSLRAVEQFRTNPEHRRYVDEYLRPRMEVIKAWNFRRTSAAG
jgi:hypothetical protein